MDKNDTPAQITCEDVMHMTTEIVASYVENNTIEPEKLTGIIKSTYEILRDLSATPLTGPMEKQKPAVPIRKSITDHYIVCLEDGKKLKMLKRYLRSNYNLSPEEYKRKWGLPADYPMVAPDYAKRRSEYAIKTGLGKGVGRKKKSQYKTSDDHHINKHKTEDLTQFGSTV